MTRVHNFDAVIRSLRQCQNFEYERWSSNYNAVCSGAPSQGQLTGEQYAPIRVAAFRHHENYMRHGLRGEAESLYHYVMVDGTPVAWMCHDGVVRLVPTPPGGRSAIALQKLAVEHLGQEPWVKEHLSEVRRDVRLDRPEWLVNHACFYMEKGALHSKYNAYPGPVVETMKNTVTEYTDDECREWASQALPYITALQEHHPEVFEQWIARCKKYGRFTGL